MYEKYEISLLKQLENQSTNWENTFLIHQRMLERIKHERLIHLIVTMSVGIGMIMSILTTLIIKEPFLLILDFPLMLLFTAYIFHYRFLENTTQKWYVLEDQISRKINKSEPELY